LAGRIEDDPEKLERQARSAHFILSGVCYRVRFRIGSKPPGDSLGAVAVNSLSIDRPTGLRFALTDVRPLGIETSPLNKTEKL
jgi:hypothetical protein